MRIGCDGSRETLHTRKLIGAEQIDCHRCGVEETRKHILENCEIYSRYRRKLERGINGTQEFAQITQGMSLTEICLYKSDLQRRMRHLGKES